MALKLAPHIDWALVEFHLYVRGQPMHNVQALSGTKDLKPHKKDDFYLPEYTT